MRLWVELLGLLSSPGNRVRWILAPGHMGLDGNEIANELAVASMCQSLLGGGGGEWGDNPPHPPLVGPILGSELESPVHSSCEGSDTISVSDFWA